VSTDDPDQLFATGRAVPGGFRFDADVARVFSDMIARSVPGYAEAVALTGWLAGRFARDGTAVTDLGCSLGATLFACARALAGRDVTLVGVDASAPMLEQARARLAALDLDPAPRLVEGDVRTVDLEPASLVALNWTLQFVPPDDRAPLLARLHETLVPGGALVLSEKVVDPDPDTQALIDGLHLDFKRHQGYSELEIAAKRTAIEDVLVPETVEAHVARLRGAGFARVAPVARSLNFVTLLAVRGDGPA
jgi:tRNA (cmo5U34)-methyltransferase